MKNTPFGDLQAEAQELLFGSKLTVDSSFFVPINNVIGWCIEQGLDIKFEPRENGLMRCVMTTTQFRSDDIIKASAKTWYEALFRCAIDYKKKGFK